jgi:hypothetical protein
VGSDRVGYMGRDPIDMEISSVLRGLLRTSANGLILRPCPMPRYA